MEIFAMCFQKRIFLHIFLLSMNIRVKYIKKKHFPRLKRPHRTIVLLHMSAYMQMFTNKMKVDIDSVSIV